MPGPSWAGPSWNDDHLNAIGEPTEVEASGNGTLIAIFKRIRTLFGGGLPTALVGGRLSTDGSGVTQPVSGTFWQATQPVSGTVTANAGTGTLAVSGPLTDTQLRATAVPISGTVTANAGTGTLAVSGTFWQATQPVSGTFWQTTQPVSGTVTANPATSAGKTITYVSVNQSAAGTTTLAAASVGNKHKVMGVVLVFSLLGTLKFTDGVGDLTGPMDIAANGGFVIPTSSFPMTETAATNRALNLVTTLGAARGVVAILTEP